LKLFVILHFSSISRYTFGIYFYIYIYIPLCTFIHIYFRDPGLFHLPYRGIARNSSILSRLYPFPGPDYFEESAGPHRLAQMALLVQRLPPLLLTVVRTRVGAQMTPINFLLQVRLAQTALRLFPIMARVQKIRRVRKMQVEYILNKDCDRCASSFSLRSNLLRHIRRVHEDIRPVRCGECGADFHDKWLLDTHIRSVHYSTPTFQMFSLRRNLLEPLPP